ncbi:probable LRR receptor-like serine/threonine-protein kinase At3g47570 [Olea europaea var. sylvestris]|uniref:probable LRR receptor-like serine/threonine-protein kinase At3g47570 n=1 Tax=Olea europaea var. sylvestris TaxID=158386 RepID=UPI000C1CF320|nr:probable LRR receptor-like serine/threonine-protein kinase At3g47570 [Olea europaea var. sylvestris]
MDTNLSINTLHGNIPQELGRLSSLKTFSLSSKRERGLREEAESGEGAAGLVAVGVSPPLLLLLPPITTTIPSHLWSLREFGQSKVKKSFWVEPSGRVPKNLGNLQNLQILIFKRNQLTNDPSMLELDFLTSLKNCRKLKIIDMEFNSFDGILPKSFDKFSASVESFIAYQCGIKGNLISLQNLDPSNNSLDGVIPESLEKLVYLEYFDVLFNELSGEIPNGGPFRNFTSNFFISNIELCGASKFKVKPCKDNKTRLSSSSRVLMSILPSIAVVFILAITVVYLIRRHSRNIFLSAQSTSPNTIKRISYYEVLLPMNLVFNLDLKNANQSFDTECQMLCNVCHRNLVKPDNILLDEDMVAHVANFGIAGLFTEDQRILITKTLGTIGYIAPGKWFLSSACV